MSSESDGTAGPTPAVESRTASAPSAEAPSLGKLFLLCLRVGLVSFGGGLTGWFYREFVMVHGWITDEEFAGSHAMAQMLPGPSVANLLISLGDQLRGPMGALTCLFGFMIGPFFAVIALATLFDSVTNVGMIQSASNGVAFTALGLMMIVCLRGIRRSMRFPPAVGVTAATAIAVGVFHWPLLPVVIGMSGIGVGMAWWRIGNA